MCCLKSPIILARIESLAFAFFRLLKTFILQLFTEQHQNALRKGKTCLKRRKDDSELMPVEPKE